MLHAVQTVVVVRTAGGRAVRHVGISGGGHAGHGGGGVGRVVGGGVRGIRGVHGRGLAVRLITAGIVRHHGGHRVARVGGE